ncbi:acyltransferase family protein [Methylobacterium sp. J-090]|uniref:acyltransferase family protein n=1 Tax=Methylobacterium sp. J-090 TaxID=2836666 RepID=UPI001FBACCA8|nr:acyltransferase [Methylobacterium sp. J-090]MCJ2079778.1 acyltransferase [Methylobacterium sp. J-090]
MIPRAQTPAPAGPHPAVEPLPALTSLRFVAAAYVLAFHFTGYQVARAAMPDAIFLGYSGVTFFFLLSGFILAYNYRRVDLSERAALVRFLRARVARVYPVYLLALAVGLPWFVAWTVKVLPPLQTLMASSVVLAPLGLHAWVPGAACALDCPSWSVSAELFFYAVFPLLLPLVLRRPGLTALATLAAWAASTALAILAWNRYAPGLSLIAPTTDAATILAQAIKYNPLLRLPEFVAGLLLFVLWERVRLPVPVLLAAAGAAALVLVAMVEKIPEPLMHNGLTALVWAPVILAGAQVRSGPLTAGWFVFLGRISFALYLLHAPAYGLVASLDRVLLSGRLAGVPWLGVTVATLLSLALASAVHLWIEEPARRRILRPRPPVRPAAAVPSA